MQVTSVAMIVRGVLTYVFCGTTTLIDHSVIRVVVAILSTSMEMVCSVGSAVETVTTPSVRSLACDRD